MSSNSDLLCSISSNGDCIAICTSDGVIKFYDTLTSNLKLEYSSSTHLQAGCTCLSWSKFRKNSLVAPNKQKKLKSSQQIEKELNDLDLIAIGTSQGPILLFSLTKAALHSQLIGNNDHVDKVNGISWCSLYTDSIYSCSDDGYIIEWSLVDSKSKNKWKGSKTGITSMSIDSQSKYLITSSKTIVVWDLSTKTQVKTLTGHSNDIFSLQFLNKNLSSSVNFFLSAAHNDRTLNAWSFDSKNLDNESKAAVATFVINDKAIFVDVLNASTKSDSLTHALILAITSKGNLHIYFHKLDQNDEKQSNKLRKPVKASHQIKLETNESNPINILGAFIANKQNERLPKIELESIDLDTKLADLFKDYFLYIVYGSQLNPKIEKLKFDELNESKLTLTREDPYRTSVKLQTESTKIETPLISNDMKLLAPGFMHPQTNNLITGSSKRKSTEPSQMSLEERLNVMGIDTPNGTTNGTSANEVNGDGYAKFNQIPKTDNLLVLLIQGLQSNDAKMLNHVLQHKNEKLIAKTIRMMPTNYVVNLVKELNSRLQGHAQSGMGIIKWLKCVLMIHTSFLMSYPDLIESLGSVYEMMNARTKLFPQLSKLQGKLQLVMSQVSSQAEALQTANEKDVQPLLYYQDSASEDEQIEDELIPSHSEFDDYNFSDEDEDENEEDDLDEIDNEENEMNIQDDSNRPIKKEVVSFKKQKAFSKSKIKKANDEDEDDEDDDDDDLLNKDEDDEDIDDDEDDEDDDN